MLFYLILFLSCFVLHLRKHTSLQETTAATEWAKCHCEIPTLLCLFSIQRRRRKKEKTVRWLPHRWQTLRYDYSFPRRQNAISWSATVPVNRLEMRIHTKLLLLPVSSGGRSRSALDHMRSPAVNHTSPGQPALTPRPRQHQRGPSPSTGDRRGSTENHSKFIFSSLQCCFWDCGGFLGVCTYVFVG